MEIDFGAIFGKMMASVFSYFKGLAIVLLVVAAVCTLVFLVGFILRTGTPLYVFKGRNKFAEHLEGLKMRFMPYDLMRWILYDVLLFPEHRTKFNQYGFSIFVGKQGAGKTISMVHYLERMKKRFPACIIVTNFKCSLADHQMTDWHDLFEIRNGEQGVIFAIDEIHSEYSASSWKDFPEALLSEISQQRKQRIKIVATSQWFSRVAKPIREQTFSVFVCSTFLGRLTRYREFDAIEYSTYEEGAALSKDRAKIKPITKSWFVQSNALRQCYDTYEKIERLEKTPFIPRAER